MPSTVIVVQSGDLAAWVGAVSGLVGVVLGAGIDSLRRHRAERKRFWDDLETVADEFAELVHTWQLADQKAQQEPAWVPVAADLFGRVRKALREIGNADMEAERLARQVITAGAKLLENPEAEAQTDTPEIIDKGAQMTWALRRAREYDQRSILRRARHFDLRLFLLRFRRILREQR